jgi:ABC-2 type transport system ATP-binding protein
MSAVDYVTYFLLIHDFDRDEANTRAKKSLVELGLQDAMHRKIRTYSRGMRQKTKVARATAFDPEILVLDEPFQGADPTTRHLLMQKIKTWSNEGKTILISSHILHDVENLTDNIVLINNGRVIASGDRHEIRKLMSNIPIQIRISPVDGKNLRPLFKRMLDEKWITAGRIMEDEGEIMLETNESNEFYTKFPQILDKEKIMVKKIVSDDDSLDSLYSKLVEGKQWK